MRLTTFGLHRACKRRASDLLARINSPAAHVCEHCHGVGCTAQEPICPACDGRGWVANRDPLQLAATALVFAALVGAWTLFLLMVAP